MAPETNYLTWIDLEMTGLNPDTDVILEIATVVTDNQLTIIAEGPNLAIRQSEERLSKMDSWNTYQHTQSRLVERVRQSRLNEADAERITLNFLQPYVRPQASPMCGNSICQDRRFLWRYMPNLEKYFHYRHLDVSTLKELADRWVPNTLARFKKDSRHRALEDIYDSIAELRYYREHLIKLS